MRFSFVVFFFFFLIVTDEIYTVEPFRTARIVVIYTVFYGNVSWMHSSRMNCAKYEKEELTSPLSVAATILQKRFCGQTKDPN